MYNILYIYKIIYIWIYEDTQLSSSVYLQSHDHGG